MNKPNLDDMYVLEREDPLPIGAGEEMPLKRYQIIRPIESGVRIAVGGGNVDGGIKVTDYEGEQAEHYLSKEYLAELLINGWVLVDKRNLSQY